MNFLYNILYTCAHTNIYKHKHPTKTASETCNLILSPFFSTSFENCLNKACVFELIGSFLSASDLFFFPSGVVFFCCVFPWMTSLFSISFIYLSLVFSQYQSYLWHFFLSWSYMFYSIPNYFLSK